MTKYRETLMLGNLGLSKQSIGDICNVSKKTANRVMKRARKIGLSWPLDRTETDAVIAERLYPSASNHIYSNKKISDFDHIRKELLRNVVNKKLLWTKMPPIRNEQFFSLADLNQAIRERLEEFIHRPFQKKEVNRYEIAS